MRGITSLAWLCSVISVGACGGGGGGGWSGDFGATPGGVKDLRLARDLIAAGKVPPPDAFVVEGMFAEHELGLTGAPCERTLCLRAGAGFSPELDGTPRGWAQVGLSSTIDPETWQRPSTTFVFVVDVSGSMYWSEENAPSALSRDLMDRLTDELRDDDRIAIVAFGSSVSTTLSLTSGANKSRSHGAIGSLSENGSTHMEAGMKRGYEIGTSAVGSTEQVRVIVFTDTQPNVGATSGSEFESMVEAAATKGVYTTTLALGTGIGPEVLRGMASLKGANAYSLTTHEHVADMMSQEYPWFTTPIAFGLRVNIGLDNGWSIDRGLGFPAASDEEAIGLKAETVFLSRKKGALLVALESPDGSPVGLSGALSLAYTEADGTAVAEELPFAYDGSALSDGRWFQQHGTDRTVALGLLAEAMHDAAFAYDNDRDLAKQTMTAAVERITADAQRLGDEDLGVEVELASAMLQLIEQGAPQGTLYGE
jgi:Ca-activated chloride channel family protein